MTGFLDIADYAAAETAALRTVPNQALGAFLPVTFQEYNYPGLVADEAELIRYVDTMQEEYGRLYIDPDYPLSVDEATLVRSVAEDVCQFTARHFGRSIRPWLAPIAAVEIFRLINAWAAFTGKKQMTVFEFGPGSGYLGALLYKAGHRHISMDNCQAFYLWQNRLYRTISGEDLNEAAAEEILPEDRGMRMIHIPWWRFLEFSKSIPFEVDFIVSEHNLTEMSSAARLFNLRVARRMLRKDGVSCFGFRHLGAASKQGGTRDSLFAEFDAAGFETIFKRLFFAALPKGSVFSELTIPHSLVASPHLLPRLFIKVRRQLLRKRHPILALDANIPLYAPSGRSQIIMGRDVVPFLSEEEPFDYPFLRFIGKSVPAPHSGG